MAEQSLKDKTVKGTFWSAADAFLGQGVTFIVGIVLARLLSPAEYGMIGIALMFTIVLGGIVDSGLSAALIRKKEVSDADYNTMFFSNIVLSFFLFVFLWVVAPFITDFFNINGLTLVVRIMGLMIIFQALSIIQVTILTKKLDFKTKTKASFVSALLSGIIGIYMALENYGVWALVMQKLSNTLSYSIFLWLLNKWCPKLQFSLKSFRYMWGFGWKITLSGIIASIWGQLHQVVIGRYYSPCSLGQFTKANEFSNIVSMHFNSIIQRVTFPVLAEVQDNNERLLLTYRKIIKITMFLIVVIMFFLGAISEPLIYCVIGSQWHEAATYLPIICVYMSLYPVLDISLNMVKVLGRSDVYLYVEIIKKILSILPLCLGIFISIYWMLMGSVVVAIISFFLNGYYPGKVLHYSAKKQLVDILPAYGMAVLVAVSVYFLKYLPIPIILILILQCVVGLSIFVIASFFFKKEEFTEIRTMASLLLKRHNI